MKSKTSLSFTAKELEILAIALNNYGLEQMQKSKTWANTEEFINNGYRQDIYGCEADESLHLQVRMYKAQRRLNK